MKGIDIKVVANNSHNRDSDLKVILICLIFDLLTHISCFGKFAIRSTVKCVSTEIVVINTPVNNYYDM